MSLTPTSAVHRQVSKASQRLFVQNLLNALVWCWTGALLAAFVWFLIQPLVAYQLELGKPDDWVRWAIAAGIFTVATGIGFGLALRRSPSKVEAALELDGRFQLRERVTTSLMLDADREQSAVGQALLADANDRVAKLDVASRFPVRLSWTALCVPGAALLLGLLGYFYNPNLSTAQAAEQPKPKEVQKFVPAKEIAQDVNNLQKLKDSPLFQNPTTEEEIAIKRRLEEILKLDPKTLEEQREQAQKIQEVKNLIKDLLEDKKAEQEKKKQDLRDALKKPGADDPKQVPEGPGKEAQQALNDGDANRAAEEMKKLADKLKNDKLDDKEKKELQKQLDDLKKQLEDAADQKKPKDDLKKDQDEAKKKDDALKNEKDNLQKEQAKLDKEKEAAKGDDKKEKAVQEKQQALDQKQQALDQKQQELVQMQKDLDKQDAKMKENADKVKDLKPIAEDLDKAQNNLKDGKDKDAGKNLDAAAEKLGKLGGNNEKDMKDLQKGLGQGGLGGAADRPQQLGGKTGSQDAKQKGDANWKGDLKLSDFSGGDKKTGVGKGADVKGAIEKGHQEASGVIDNQSIPEAQADFVKGYTENLNNGLKGAKK